MVEIETRKAHLRNARASMRSIHEVWWSYRESEGTADILGL